MMKEEQLRDQIIEALENIKATDITCIDVREKTDITDFMIIASGTSVRHVKAIASSVVDDMKKEHDERPLSEEGESGSDWVLVDYAHVVLHVMLPEARDFYDIESLWEGAGE